MNRFFLWFDSNLLSFFVSTPIFPHQKGNISLSEIFLNFPFFHNLNFIRLPHIFPQYYALSKMHFYTLYPHYMHIYNFIQFSLA